MAYMRCLAVLSALVPMSIHAQDLNEDGKFDFNDTNAARSDESLEELLFFTDHPRGDLDGDREVSFADFLVFAKNYGTPGDYTDGDLNLDGVVGFADWPIYAANFGRSTHAPPPPPRLPGDPFTISVDSASGRIVLSGGRTILNGLRVQSASGALLTGPSSDGVSGVNPDDPFEYEVFSTPFEVSYVSLVVAENSSDELILPFGISEGTEISEIEFTWSRPGSYETFDFVHDAPSADLPGDFNSDGVLSDIDIDLLSREVHANSQDRAFDLDNDQMVNQQDRQVWVEDLAGTQFGDADLDGAVQFNDFLALSENFAQAGGWGTGDFDGSGDIQFADFLLLSNSFGKASTNAQSVPEPSGLAIMVECALFTCLRRYRNVERS